jgi:hypothetical protein
MAKLSTYQNHLVRGLKDDGYTILEVRPAPDDADWTSVRARKGLFEQLIALPRTRSIEKFYEQQRPTA